MVTFLFLVMFMQFFLVLADGGGGVIEPVELPPPYLSWLSAWW